MLEIRNLTKSFGQKKILNDLSLELRPGVVALLGPNGAGKTTLLRCLLELYPPDAGKVFWEGQPVEHKGILPGKCGYLPQNFGVFPNLTVFEMMEYFAVLKNIPKRKRTQEILKRLEQVSLSQRVKSPCRTLSGGMIRRLGIAQALLGDPPVLVFDEPTAGLDPEERLRFKLLIHDLSKERIILISTHIVGDVEALCSQVVVMDSGQVIADLPRGELVQKAKGLVWKVPKEDNVVLPQGAYIRAMGEDLQGDILFVLSQTPVGESVAPTLEDGYLCYLKGINP